MKTATVSLKNESYSAQGSYGNLIVWSMGLTLLFVFGLLGLGRLEEYYVTRLRNFLGYGHFTLAYIFTWRLICRRYGSPEGAFRYLAVFLGVITLYALLQRFWLPTSLDYLFILALFMNHHFSNEILFRQQVRNGYQPLAWSVRCTHWVALGIGLAVIDQMASPTHLWHEALPGMALLWVAIWMVYGWRYLRSRVGSLPFFGWATTGLLGILCTTQPFREPLFTPHVRFGWIVIYHYIVWYVFYTRKLLNRTGQWRKVGETLRTFADLWRYAITVPAGFLGLVLVGNAVIFVIFQTTNPLAHWITRTTDLHFFHLNTAAHILFGLGLPRAVGAKAVPRPKPFSTEQHQFVKMAEPVRS